MSTTFQSDQVRAANRRALYRALARPGEHTRAELAQATGLSLPTVTTILADLGEVGVVREAGLISGTGGRPAQRVRFDPNARHVLAVDLSGRRARACRVDLAGSVVASVEGPDLVPGAATPLLEWLRPLVRDATHPPVRRLALAVPGVVDPVDGHVDLAPALGWHDHAVTELFESALGVGVVLENDVNALALAELHYGVGARHRHVLYVAIGSGVGAGLVIDGALYRGAHAAAGEIGYSVPMADGTPGPPGGPGPLERRLLEVAERCIGGSGRLDLRAPGAAQALGDITATLRPVLHNLACVLDPELLVVAWTADPDGLLAARLRDGWMGPRPLPIVAGTLGRDGAARGAAYLALERVEQDLCRHRSHHVALPAERPVTDGGATAGAAQANGNGAHV